MAQSFAQYKGDGTTRVYAVPFKYLDRSHVRVTVSGVTVPFDWLAPNSIRLVTAAPASTEFNIDIRRSTPNDKPLVDFSDGSTITEEDLDKLAYQNVFLSQEAIDLYTEVDGVASGLVGLVQQALNSSATSEANSSVALVKATNAENTVLNTASQVNVDAAQANLDAYNANLDAEAASASANTAISNAAVATEKSAIAVTAATQAEYYAGIAQTAANFNPEDFYTRVQMDGILQTTSFELSQIIGLNDAIAAKAEAVHTHTVAQVSGLQGILDGKLNTTANAASATKWATARSITLAGDATGSVSLDGSANVTLTVAVADNSHLHQQSDISGLVTALAGKAASSHTHGIADVTNLQSTLDGKAASSHTHTIAQVTNLQSTLDGKATSAALTSGLAAKANTAHSHAISDVSGLQSALDGKAGSSHGHAISDVTGLQAALDGKASLPLTTTGNTVTVFPVGTVVVCSINTGTAPERNSTTPSTLRLDSNASDYVFNGSGPALAGTWLSRGRIRIAGDVHFIMQRVS